MLLNYLVCSYSIALKYSDAISVTIQSTVTPLTIFLLYPLVLTIAIMPPVHSTLNPKSAKAAEAAHTLAQLFL